MIRATRLPWERRHVFGILVAAAVLMLAYILGRRASVTWLVLLAALPAGLALLRQPALGLLALVVAALVVPFAFGTGTEVSLNAATLLVPTLVAVWLLSMVTRGEVRIAKSRVNRPLFLFLVAGLLSLLVGLATWDPSVPRSDNFTFVQLAQWAVFAFSVLAFWLTANLAHNERMLRLPTFTFVALGGAFAVLSVIPSNLAHRLGTEALTRAPFWVLLFALAGGQLLHNRSLILPVRAGLAIVGAACLVYAFVAQQEAISNWVGLSAVMAVLVWLRLPRLRWPMALVLVVLIALGVVFPAVYQFAGGDAEWAESGNSRLVLIQRVVEVTMRNPITGLGPAAYRPYAGMKPLSYGRAYWLEPQINSHNNYVDLFSHGGVLGLALFAWFVVEVARLGVRLHRQHPEGFLGGYASGMLAAGAGSLVLMMFADWILPFVYNIGFPGFQASMLVWLFMGGLVGIENMKDV